jgi:hypothetical protein
MKWEGGFQNILLSIINYEGPQVTRTDLHSSDPSNCKCNGFNERYLKNNEPFHIISDLSIGMYFNRPDPNNLFPSFYHERGKMKL